MTIWVMNLLPNSVRCINLLLHLIPILSFLPCWSLSLLSEWRLKPLNLHDVVLIKTHLSSFWMTRFWIFWTSKRKPRVGLNRLAISIHFSQRYFFLSILSSHILMFFCFSFSHSTIISPNIASILLFRLVQIAIYSFEKFKTQHQLLIWLLHIS